MIIGAEGAAIKQLEFNILNICIILLYKVSLFETADCKPLDYTGSPGKHDS